MKKKIKDPAVLAAEKTRDHQFRNWSPILRLEFGSNVSHFGRNRSLKGGNKGGNKKKR